MTRRGWLLSSLLLGACGGADPPLVRPDQIVGDTIPNALTEAAGDPRQGELVFSAREQGHCVLCHVVEGLEVPFQGNIGPDLSEIGLHLSPAQLRLRVVDYQIILPGALMPSYYRNHDLYQVEEAYLGKTILTAQQVEDVVAYLSQLDEEADDER